MATILIKAQNHVEVKSSYTFDFLLIFRVIIECEIPEEYFVIFNAQKTPTKLNNKLGYKWILHTMH